MTDTDKSNLQQMLIESQNELEQLRNDNKSLSECLNLLEQQGEDEEGEPVSQVAFRRLKNKFLSMHSEKTQLLEKLEARDAEVKELREGNRPPVEYPDVQRSLSTGEPLSPEDPMTEVHRLRSVLDDKEKKIQNLNMQLKSFQEVASVNADLEEQIAQLKKQLQVYSCVQ